MLIKFSGIYDKQRISVPTHPSTIAPTSILKSYFDSDPGLILLPSAEVGANLLYRKFS